MTAHTAIGNLTKMDIYGAHDKTQMPARWEEARMRQPMKQGRGRERRHHPRHGLSANLRGRQLAPLGSPKARKSVIQGRIENTGATGLCLLTNDAMKVSYLLQCEIIFPKTPAAIPTLTQVRWIQKNAKGFRYRVALQFLL